MQPGLTPAGSLPASMLHAVPRTACEDVAALVLEHYGFQPQVRRLTSERDEIFRLISPEAQDFILRLAHPAAEAGVLHMQAAALEAIRMSDPWLPVPRLVRTLGGSVGLVVEAGNAPPRTAHLTTCVKGLPLSVAPPAPRRGRVVGTVLARLALALREFVHPAASHHSPWDVRHASGVRSLLPSGPVPEPREDRWDLVRTGLDHFERSVQPALAGLRQQAVHGDLNPHNILVDPAEPERISGIFDFGDMVRTQLVNDLAIAASYHVDGPEGLLAVAEIVQAYHAVLPLRPEEIELLHGLMVARLCMNVTISAWRARLMPGNRDHILKNIDRAWRGLQCLAEVPSGVAHTLFLRSCGMRLHFTSTPS